MSHIYDSLKNFITPELILEITNSTGEEHLKIESALNSLISGLLESLLIVEDDNSAIEFALRKAGKEYANINSNLNIIFSGKADERTYYLGGRFLDALFLNKTNSFISLIANASEISNKSADKLVFIFTPIIAASLGDKLIMRKINLSRLVTQINTEKEHFSKYLPSGLHKLLEGQSSTRKSNLTYTNSTSPALEVNNNEVNFLKWGLIILGLILLFLWWYYYL